MGLEISGNDPQHVLCVISQGQRIHSLCSRGQCLGEVLPLLKDWFHIL